MTTLKLLLAVTALLPSMAYARPELVDLDLREREFNSADAVIPLRNLVERHYGGRVNLEDFRLDSVEVLAKSQRGAGEIYLSTGAATSVVQRISGNPRDYDTPRVGYALYSFLSPRESRGVWDLHLRGNLKIDRIRVFLSEDRRPPRGEYYRIGSIGNGNPFGGWDTDVVNNPQVGRFLGVALRLSRGIGLEIRDIQVICRDGRVCFQREIGAELDDRRSLQLNFRGPLNVQSVRVRSRSTGLSIPSSKADVFLVR